MNFYQCDQLILYLLDLQLRKTGPCNLFIVRCFTSSSRRG